MTQMSANPRGLKVLIVEDDAFQLRVMAQVIKGVALLTLDTASDARQASELIASTPPDLLICSINMPGQEGMSVLRAAAESEKDIYVAISSHSDPQLTDSIASMARQFGLPHLEVLPKPFNQSAARQLIENASHIPRTAQSQDATETDFSREEILAAFEHDQLRAYFQPQFDVVSGRVVGAEALIRWAHPSMGVLLPGSFLENLFEFDLLDKLTRTVLRGAMHGLAHWREMGCNFGVSVNVGPQSVVCPDVINYIQACLENYSLPGELLTVEVAESSGHVRLPESLENLSRLRLLGVNLAVDDFGSRYATLSQLLAGPFNELKLDRIFVRNVHSSKRHRVLVEQCLRMADALGMRAVVEGVDDKRAVEFLRGLGHVNVQGFYFSKALPLTSFVKFAKQRNQPHI